MVLNLKTLIYENVLNDCFSVMKEKQYNEK